MRVLIISNKVHDSINPALPHLLGTTRDLGADIKCDVLIAGHQLDGAAQTAAGLARVNQVLLLDDPHLEHILAENIATQLAQLVKDYTHVLVNADSFGKNLLPRIAGILESGQISEIIKVVSPDTFKKFIYAGNVLIEVQALEQIKLLSVRANNFTADNQAAPSPAPITKIALSQPVSDKIKFVSNHVVDKSVDLSSAKVVVSGGISLGSKQAFDNHIRGLASKLNAAVGASRAAVEAGYAENDCQVGQTGTVVAPQVYFAIGISGAVQHIAGMKDSKTVIAINSDKNAPIFEHADYGIVGDLFEIVPQLTDKF